MGIAVLRRVLVGATLVLILGPQGAAAGLERVNDPASVPGELLVRFRADVSAAERSDALAAHGATAVRRLGASGATLVRIPAGTSLGEAVAELERDPRVLYAERNSVYRSTSAQTPNDPLLSDLWGLSAASDKDIDAPEAWDLNTGSETVVVAVIDTGVAYGHPDLAPNLWVNDDPPGGGDEDANGKVDDTHGWDFVQNDATPLDYNGHGTHVAGTIGAQGDNGLGVVGVNWDVAIMPLRAGDAAGNFPASTVAAAIEYACSSGADIVNGSFAGPDFSQTIADAITSPACENTLFVFAAGNDGRDLELNGPANDAYPCELHRSPAAGGVFAENVLCVAASDQTDGLAGFSNSGATAVHLAAPGAGIVSTTPGYAPLPGFPDGFDGQFAARWGDRTATEGSLEWDRAGPPFTLTDSPGGDYAPNSDTSIGRLSPFSTVGKSGCRLAYDLKLDTEEGADWLEIGAGPTSEPGSVDGYSGSTGGVFVEKTTDLSALDGLPSLFLRFRLLSGPTDDRDGAYLDNVSAECLDLEGGGYAAPAGTSSAAPHVSGVAALLLSRNPSRTVAELKAAILGGIDPVAGLEDKVLTGGRLNAATSLASVADGAPPETTISSAPPALTKSASATFTFRANEAATFECALDAAAFAPCTSPHQLTGLTHGAHAFHVRAIDTQTNADATPAEHTWAVDLTRPNTTITAGPRGTVNARRATFRFRSSEAGSTFQCRYKARPWTTCSSPKLYTGLRSGPQTFRVRAVDAARNVDATPAKRTWRIR